MAEPKWLTYDIDATMERTGDYHVFRDAEGVEYRIDGQTLSGVPEKGEFMQRLEEAKRKVVQEERRSYGPKHKRPDQK